MKQQIDFLFEKFNRIKHVFKNDSTLDQKAKNYLMDVYSFRRKNMNYQNNNSLFVEFVLNYKLTNFSIFFINLYDEQDFKEDEKYLYIGNDGGSDGNLCIDKSTGEVLIFDYINNFKIETCYNNIDDFLLKLLDSYIFFLENTKEYILKNIDDFLSKNIDVKFRAY